jgi:hypothetical protein
MEEQSRHFRTRLRMEERAKVRQDTLAGLLQSLASTPAGSTVHSKAPSSEGPLTVFEFWEARTEEDRPKLEAIFREHGPKLARVPGMLSVEFDQVRGKPGRYLALFRYASESQRAGFLASPEVAAMRREADPCWKVASESTWAYGF